MTTSLSQCLLNLAKGEINVGYASEHDLLPVGTTLNQILKYSKMHFRFKVSLFIQK